MAVSDNSMLDRIINYIRTENLAPGDPIPSVRELADLWGIGRSIVHQGFIQAETLGLIHVRPRSGAFVKVPDYSVLADALVASLNPAVMFDEHATISHLNNARIAIEVEIAGQAARKQDRDDLVTMREVLDDFIGVATDENASRTEFVDFDEKFHLEIARMAGNPVLYNMLKALLVLLRVQRVSSVKTHVINRLTVEAHTKIYEAICAGNPDEARETVRAHLSLVPPPQ